MIKRVIENQRERSLEYLGDGEATWGQVRVQGQLGGPGPVAVLETGWGLGHWALGQET